MVFQFTADSVDPATFTDKVPLTGVGTEAVLFKGKDHFGSDVKFLAARNDKAAIVLFPYNLTDDQIQQLAAKAMTRAK